MNSQILHLLHQAFFGGVAAAGFGILFNCPRRMLWICFGAGALALLVRTLALEAHCSLATATFLAAFVLGVVDRLWQQPHTLRGCVLGVVGCIPMVPGGFAANVLMSFFKLMHAEATQAAALTPQVLENFLSVTFTLIAMGIGLAIPSLVFPLPAED
ncbi:MAG: threonine/serine exporter family protein [Chthoniobacteraceae bacterium]